MKRVLTSRPVLLQRPSEGVLPGVGLEFADEERCGHDRMEKAKRKRYGLVCDAPQPFFMSVRANAKAVSVVFPQLWRQSVLNSVYL
jgi:hypothetical protein